MGLLERRRLLLQNAADNALDGKYIAFIGIDLEAPHSSSIYLSSDYGKNFEKVLNYSVNLPSEQQGLYNVGISLDVVSGEPIIYFCSGSFYSGSSFGTVGIYSYNHSTREVSLITEDRFSQYSVSRTALQVLDNGENFYLNLSQSHYTEPDHEPLGIKDFPFTGFPTLGGCKSRNKGRHFVIAAKCSPVDSFANGLWASNFKTLDQFKGSVQEMYWPQLPSSSRPEFSTPISDADVNPQGTVVAYNIFDRGLAIMSEQDQTWRLVEPGQLVTGSINYIQGVTFSENKTFISFVSQSREYLASFSSNSPAQSNLEFVSPLIADGEPVSGSLWSNKRGDKLIKASTFDSRLYPKLQYSEDGGLSWNYSSWNSGSARIALWGISVYRI